MSWAKRENEVSLDWYEKYFVNARVNQYESNYVCVSVEGGETKQRKKQLAHVSTNDAIQTKRNETNMLLWKN